MDVETKSSVKIMAKILERWLDIKGFEGYYRISDQGQVLSLRSRGTLAPWYGTTSLYGCVGLYKDGKRTKFTIHRLVAQHFLPEWNPKLEVNHIDGDRDNNAVSNLRMSTHQECVRHGIILLLKNDYGEKNSNAKLTNAQAVEIRNKYHAGSISQATLASQYHVCRQTISAIVRYKKYIR